MLESVNISPGQVKAEITTREDALARGATQQVVLYYIRVRYHILDMCVFVCRDAQMYRLGPPDYTMCLQGAAEKLPRSCQGAAV